jgi:drug/metabolite transporter (DMT)-like permease
MSAEAKGSRALAWACLFAIYVVWGTTYLAIRVVVREMPPFAAAALRFSSSGIVLGVLAMVFERAHGWPSLRQWRDYGIAGVCFLAGGNAGVMWAEQRVPSGLAALLVATVPLWVTFLDGLRPGGQPWTRRVWIGVLLGFVGVVFVARPQDAGQGGHWSGIAALQVAALLWTFGALYVQSFPRKLATFSATAVEMIVGSAVLFLESRVAGEDLGRVAHASPDAWRGLAYLAVFGSLVGFTAFAYALHELPASTVGTYAYVNPVVAVLLGRVFLAEPLAVSTLVGAALIIVAVVVTTHRSAPAAEAAD